MTGSTAVTPPSPVPVPVRPRRHRDWRQALVGWAFALPFVVLFGAFMAGPIVISFVTSFTDMRIANLRDPLGVGFVGLDNYFDVFRDPTFRKAARNTAFYVVFAVPLTIGLGLLVAIALNQGALRFRRLFRVGYFVPYVTSIVAVAVVWRLLLGTDSGLVNNLLESIGIDGPGWLTDQRYSLWSIILMTTWRGLGLQMIIFLAGLQAIPAELYEAASVDGAGRWHKFRYVTFPQLRPTLLFSTVIASIGLMQFFEEPYVMTEGGPLDSTLSVAFHAYNEFSFGNYGYTAAISYVLFLVTAALAFVQFKFLKPNTE